MNAHRPPDRLICSNRRGIGQLALEAVAVHDAAAVIFSALVLTALFATPSAIADLSQPRALYAGA